MSQPPHSRPFPKATCNAKRRILWLSHLLPWPPKGGLPQRSYHLLREVARNHQVRVIAFCQRAHQKLAVQRQAAEAAISEIADVAHVADLPADRITGGQTTLALRSLFPGPPYTIRWGLSDDFRHYVTKEVKEFRPHAVHFDTLSLAPYVPLVGAIPAVLNHHNIESEMLLRRCANEHNLFRRLYFWQEARRLASYERRIAFLFCRHLVCSDLDAQRLIRLVGPVRTEVVPNGVDLDYFVPAPHGTTQVPDSLVFVGGLSWYPNASAIRFFLNSVWPLLIARRPTIRFNIIGRAPPSDIIRAAEQDSRIKLLGFLDDIRPVVHQSMVYVCPIFDGGGTKLKMLDAMAMGKAIVAHPVACEGLRLTPGYQVLSASTPIEFALQIIKLMESPETRQQLELRAREHVHNHFSVITIGRALSDIYATLGQDRNVA